MWLAYKMLIFAVRACACERNNAVFLHPKDYRYAQVIGVLWGSVGFGDAEKEKGILITLSDLLKQPV